MKIDMSAERTIGFLTTPVKAFPALTNLKQENPFF